jgi:hypothetical protein
MNKLPILLCLVLLLAPACGPTSTPAPIPAFTPTLISCVATTSAEYIISGGSDPDAGIFVDDILRVFVNADLVTEVSQGGRCCPPAPPICFIANTRDVLRAQAQDANNCYSLETLWLQRTDGSCLTRLTKDISGPSCGSEPLNQVFLGQTFDLL